MVNVSTKLKLSPAGIVFIILFIIFCILYAKDKLPSVNLGTTDRSGLLKAFRLQGTRPKHISNSSISIKKLISASIYAAEMGGRVLLDIRKRNKLNIQSKGKTAEGVMDPVTEGDLESHRTIFGILKGAWPRLNVVSEEKENKENKKNNRFQLKVDYHNLHSQLKSYKDEEILLKDVTVWIDPLDATKEYTENLMEYVTTMVCVAVKGIPVAGVIHQPQFGNTYWGWVKHGHSGFNHKSYKEEKPRIIVSRSHAGSVNKTLKEAFSNGFSLRSAGGAGYKVLAVAKGAADVYVHVTAIKKWDLCAGNALINSIGGSMTDLEGQTIKYYPNNDVKLKTGLLVTYNNHMEFLSHFKNFKSLS